MIFFSGIAVFATLTGAVIGKVAGPIVIPVVAGLGRLSCAAIRGLGFFSGRGHEVSTAHLTEYGTETRFSTV